MTKLPLALLVMAFLVPFSNAKRASSWDYCGSSENYKVKVEAVTVIPDPVIRGVDATFEIPALTEETILGGSLIVEVYFHGVCVHIERDDLCKKTSCPISPGSFKVNNTQGLPIFTPPGPYRLNLKVQDLTSTLLTCVKVNFDIVKTAEIQSE